MATLVVRHSEYHPFPHAPVPHAPLPHAHEASEPHENAVPKDASKIGEEFQRRIADRRERRGAPPVAATTPEQQQRANRLMNDLKHQLEHGKRPDHILQGLASPHHKHVPESRTESVEPPLMNDDVRTSQRQEDHKYQEHHKLSDMIRTLGQDFSNLTRLDTLDDRQRAIEAQMHDIAVEHKHRLNGKFPKDDAPADHYDAPEIQGMLDKIEGAIGGLGASDDVETKIQNMIERLQRLKEDQRVAKHAHSQDKHKHIVKPKAQGSGSDTTFPNVKSTHPGHGEGSHLHHHSTVPNDKIDESPDIPLVTTNETIKALESTSGSHYPTWKSAMEKFEQTIDNAILRNAEYDDTHNPDRWTFQFVKMKSMEGQFMELDDSIQSLGVIIWNALKPSMVATEAGEVFSEFSFWNYFCKHENECFGRYQKKYLEHKEKSQTDFNHAMRYFLNAWLAYANFDRRLIRIGGQAYHMYASSIDMDHFFRKFGGHDFGANDEAIWEHMWLNLSKEILHKWHDSVNRPGTYWTIEELQTACEINSAITFHEHFELDVLTFMLGVEFRYDKVKKAECSGIKKVNSKYLCVASECAVLWNKWPTDLVKFNGDFMQKLTHLGTYQQRPFYEWLVEDVLREWQPQGRPLQQGLTMVTGTFENIVLYGAVTTLLGNTDNTVGHLCTTIREAPDHLDLTTHVFREGFENLFVLKETGCRSEETFKRVKIVERKFEKPESHVKETALRDGDYYPFKRDHANPPVAYAQPFRHLDRVPDPDFHSTLTKHDVSVSVKVGVATHSSSSGQSKSAALTGHQVQTELNLSFTNHSFGGGSSAAMGAAVREEFEAQRIRELYAGNPYI